MKIPESIINDKSSILDEAWNDLQKQKEPEQAPVEDVNEMGIADYIVDGWDALVDYREQQNNQVMAQAVKYNPVQESEASKLGRKFGVSQTVASENLDEMRQKNAVQNAIDMNLQSAAPTLSNHMSNLDFAKKAYDDLEALRALEGNMIDYQAVATEAALNTVRDLGVASMKGVVGLGQAFIGVPDFFTGGRYGKWLNEYTGLDFSKTQKEIEKWYSPSVRAGLKEVEQAKGVLPTLEALVTNPNVIATSVAESLPAMAGGQAVGQGLVSKFPQLARLTAAALGEGVVSLGSATEQIRESTEDKQLTGKQVFAAGASGVGTALFSFVGNKLAGQLGFDDIDSFLIKGGKDAIGVTEGAAKGFAKRLIGSGISEGLFEEMWQSMQEQAWQNYALDKPITQGLAEAGTMGAVVGVAAGSGFSIYSMTLEAKGGKAKRTKELLNTIDENAANSKLKKNDPQSFEELVQEQADTNGVGEMYIEADTLVDILNQQNITKEQFAEQFPEIESQINDAIASGEAVKIPMSQYATYMSGTDLGNEIKNHLRTSPDDYTEAEYQQIKDTITEYEKSLEAVRQETEIPDDAFNESIKNVSSIITEQMKNTGRYSNEEIKSGVTLVTNFIEQIARHTNAMPTDVYKLYPYKLEDRTQKPIKLDAFPEEDAEMYNQQGKIQTESEAFKNWFGDSKVVDDAGEPLVVYHGTDVEFNEFNKEFIGSNFNADDIGFFFTDSKEIAKQYSETTSYGTNKEGGLVLETYLTLENPYIHKIDFDPINEWDNNSSMIIKKAKEMDSDGVIIKSESGDNLYVAFEPTQIKSTENQGTFDPQDPNIYRQQALTPETTKMLSIHNISADKLVYADKIGGLAVPSIGVITDEKGGIGEGFGEITMIGTKNLVEPGKTPVFSADAYSARFPKPEWKKAKTKDAEKLMKEIRPIADEFDSRGITSETWDNLVNYPNADRIIRDWIYSDAIQVMYLREQGLDIEPVMVPAQLGIPIPDDKINLIKEKYDAIDDNKTWTEIEESKEYADLKEEYRRIVIENYKTKFAEKYDERVERMANKVAGDFGFREFNNLNKVFQRVGTMEIDKYATRDILKPLIDERAADFKSWVENKILPLFPEPYLVIGRKKVPYNLDNIVKSMTKGSVVGKEKTMTVSEGQVKAASAVQFKDIEQMRESAKESIIDPEEFEKQKEITDKLLDDYRTSVADYSLLTDWRGDINIWEALDSSMRALAKWSTKKAKDINSLKTELKKEDFDVEKIPNDILEKGLKAGKSLLKAPVPYFEAKPQRAVTLDEFVGAVIPENTPQAARDILDKNGVEYIEYGKDDDRNKMIRELSGKLYEAGKETLFQKQPVETTPRAGFSPERLTTFLYEKADYSSFIHETSHFFMTVYMQIASSPDAPAGIKQDVQTMLDWFGVKDIDEWNSLTFEQQAKYQEQFAYNFEVFTFGGKAPSVKMQGIFHKFRSWLTRIYKDVLQGINRAYRAETGEDLPVLTEEVKAVMNRMLATESEIEYAESVRNMTGLFTNQEDSGMSDEEWQAYEQMSEQATSEAVDNLSKDGMRQVKWVKNARSRELRKILAEKRAERKEARKQAIEIVSGMPVYQAINYLRKGILLNGDEADNELQHKFNLAEVKRMFPKYSVQTEQPFIDELVDSIDVVQIMIDDKTAQLESIAQSESYLSGYTTEFEAVVSEIEQLQSSQEELRNLLQKAVELEDTVPKNYSEMSQEEKNRLFPAYEYLKENGPIYVKSETKTVYKNGKAVEIQYKPEEYNVIPNNFKTKDSNGRTIDEISMDYGETYGLDISENEFLELFTENSESVKEAKKRKKSKSAKKVEMDKLNDEKQEITKDIQRYDESIERYKKAVPTRPDYTKLGMGKYGMVAADGAPPDMIAAMFGYESGQQLINDILSSNTYQDEVSALTDQIIEQSELSDPEYVEDRIESAIHNDARAKFVAVQARFLSKIKKPVRVLLNAAKLMASKTISNKVIKDIKPREYSSAETRAGMNALKAMQNNEPEQAIKYTHQQLLNNQLAKQAADAKLEIEKALKSFKELFKPDKKLSKTRDMDLINAARSILAAYGIGKADKAPDDYLKQMKDYDPDVYTTLEPIMNEATENAKDFKELTMDEFRQLRDSIKAIVFESKRKNKIKVDGRLVDLKKVLDEFTARHKELGVDTKKVPGEESALTGTEKALRGLNYEKAFLRRVESFCDAMDGVTKGAWTRYIWEPIKEATNRYRALRNDYVHRYVEMTKQLNLPLGKISTMVDGEETIGYTFGVGNGGNGKAELLGALLHTGNESNLRKLLMGRKGWGTWNAETKTLDTSKWDRFIQHAMSTGIITKADMDWVQGVWDLLEVVKPHAQKAHKEIYGFYFNEVEAQEIETPFGTYRGGYVPAGRDRDLVPKSNMRDAMEDLKNDFHNMIPSTGSGFTKARVDLTEEALTLDVRKIAKHIDDVLRFAEIQPAIKDVDKILNNKEFQRQMGILDYNAIGEMLKPWLMRTAQQTVSITTDNKQLDNFLNSIRRRSGAALMFANFVNTVQQLTGFSVALLKVQGDYLRGASLDYLNRSKEMTAEIVEQSQFMNDRLNNQIFELQDQMNDIILNPNKLQKMDAWSAKHAYFMQTAMQNMIDPIIWSAAYNQYIANADPKMEQRLITKNAVRAGDAAVRMTQDSFQPEDIARYQAGTAMYKLFTQFSGYFNMLANLNGTEYVKLFRDIGFKNAPARMAQIYVCGWLVPMVVAEAMVKGLRGQWDDDDENQLFNDTVDLMFWSQFRGGVATVPLYGQIGTGVWNSFDNKPYNDRMMSAPGISMLERGAKGISGATVNAIDKGELSSYNVRDIFTLMSLVFGWLNPVGKSVKYEMDVKSGKVKPTSGLDYIRGLATGSASTESRK